LAIFSDAAVRVPVKPKWVGAMTIGQTSIDLTPTPKAPRRPARHACRTLSMALLCLFVCLDVFIYIYFIMVEVCLFMSLWKCFLLCFALFVVALSVYLSPLIPRASDQSKLDELFGLEVDSTAFSPLFAASSHVHDNGPTHHVGPRNWNDEYYRRLLGVTEVANANLSSVNASNNNVSFATATTATTSGAQSQPVFACLEEAVAGVRPLVDEFERHCLVTAAALFQSHLHELTKERALQRGYNLNVCRTFGVCLIFFPVFFSFSFSFSLFFVLFISNFFLCIHS
jgi:hypothetical protein